MAETHVIEVRAGRGEPPSLELRPGLELAPLSVGTGGAWQVSAPGVRVVHLYLYFDGQTLFLQSADASDPLMMDGQPVPTAWTRAPAPCTVTFGQARLAFHPADQASGSAPPPPKAGAMTQPLARPPLPSSGPESGEEEATIAAPLPDNFQHDPRVVAARAATAAAIGQIQPIAPQARPAAMAAPTPAPARPFKPGAFAAPAGDESTRFKPIEAEDYGPPSGDSTRVEPLRSLEGVSGPTPGHVRPAAGAPWMPPTSAMPAMAPGSPGLGMPGLSGSQGAGAGFHGRQFPPPPPNIQIDPGQQPPSSGPSAPSGPSGPPSGLLNVPPPPSLRHEPPPATFQEKVAHEWKAAPPLRKGLLIALPIVLIGAAVMFFGVNPPEPTPPPSSAQKAGSKGSNGTASNGGSNQSGSNQGGGNQGGSNAGSAGNGGSNAGSAGNGGSNQGGSNQGNSNPGNAGNGGSQAQNTPPPPPPPPPATNTASNPPPVPAGDGGSSDHRERQAADFVSTHNYDQAIRLYDELAADHAQNPAFREAARILRLKMASGQQ